VDLLQGALDMLVLKAQELRAAPRLRRHPAHSAIVWGTTWGRARLPLPGGLPDPGGAAPISSKWGAPETGRRAKFYRLTKAGSKQGAPRKRAGIGSPWPLRRSEKQS